jgi:hypothetical protein
MWHVWKQMKIVPTLIASWLPLSPMNIEREGFKSLYVENQSLHGVKCLVAHVSKYQIYV